MGVALSMLRDRGYQIVSVSVEPDSVIAGYWQDRLPRPLSLEQSLGSLNGFAEVPALLAIDSLGRVQAAFRGYIRSWGPHEVVAAIEKASPMSPDGRSIVNR